MTLKGVMAVTLRYFTEVGKPALQKTMFGGIYARVYCIFSACTMSSQRKFTFAISYPDEFLVLLLSLSIVKLRLSTPNKVYDDDDDDVDAVMLTLYLYTCNVNLTSSPKCLSVK